VVFSVDPSTTASGCLVPSMSIPSDHAQVVSEVHPIDHHCDQVHLREVPGEHIGQRVLGHRHELARDADLLVDLASATTCSPTGSNATG